MNSKQIKAMIIGFICAATLTSCTMSFTDLKEQISADKANSIASVIDDTDLTQEEEVKALGESIVEWSSDIDGTFVAAHLERVVDGDTIVVDIDGESYKVRLIGVNTPESVASQEYLDRTGKENTEEGSIASEYTKEVLKNIDTVYLQTDVSDTDRYDRLLRYVWTELPDDEWSTIEIETKMLNAMLIEDNMAAVEIYPPDELYADTFFEIARESNNTLTDYSRE